MMKKTVLVVDDDDMILMMTENILSANYNVVKASSGNEALEKYGEVHPDIVLADYVMPGMSGFQMLDAMHEKFSDRIFVLFMTGNETEDTEFEVYKHGAVGFIRKPIKADTLINSIESCLAKLDAMKEKSGI